MKRIKDQGRKKKVETTRSDRRLEKPNIPLHRTQRGRCGLTFELNGSVTCNDFFTCGSVTRKCLSTLMYALLVAEEQSVTAWHLCSCDIIVMLIWQHTNYDSWQDNTGKHFALPVYLTWPFLKNGCSSDDCLLLWYLLASSPPFYLQLQSHGKCYWLAALLWKLVTVFATPLVIYCPLTRPWIPVQSETHIVIKSIKFLSL